jgi:hypothetical protein
VPPMLLATADEVMLHVTGYEFFLALFLSADRHPVLGVADI